MIVVLIFLTAYCILLLALHVGWQRAIRERENQTTFYPIISVVIPFRNESENLALILNDLRQQDYSNYEVILVNDHSTDGSLHVAEQNRFPNVSIIQNLQAGKKAALASGIAIAKGEIIATTDADCRLGKHWLESIRRSFANPKTKFAFGAVGIRPESSFLSALQSVEFASLIGSGAAMSAWSAPIMCNGANLAFRKETFHAVDGYRGNEHIASGDDEFLMRKIETAFPGAVKFIPYKDATVLTGSQKSIRSFVHQRLRWAGKWRYNTSILTLTLTFFIFFAQLSVLVGFVSLIISLNYSVLILLLLKLVLEGTLINRICRFSQIPMHWPAFVVLQVLYPFYVLFIGTVTNFVNPTWKGRQIKSRGMTQKA